VDSTEAAAGVIVVGAGPAGAATAILLAERGLPVTLLDRARFPRDKVCGEYLSPEAGRILDRLGVLKAVEGAGARPLRGMRITAPDGSVAVGDYPREGRWRGYRDHALAVRRRHLDLALVERARELGVRVREGARVTGVVTADAPGRPRGRRRVAGVELAPVGAAPAERLAARVVVGADGRASVIAHRLGAVRPHGWLSRVALVAYLEGMASDAERGEIFLAPPAYAIANPVGEGQVNLSLVVPLAVARREKGDLAGYFDGAVRALPHLGERLGGARRVSAVRALGPLAYHVTPPRQDGVLLVGDALGFLDPFTGEGVYTALRSAELAAEVIAAALASGDCSHRTLAVARRRSLAEGAAKARVTALLQLVIARPRLATRVVRGFGARPPALATLMGVVGDFVPPREVLRPSYLARLFC
jgi:geranylgeranyl reductase family protein